LLGLPDNAELMLLAQHAHQISRQLHILQETQSDLLATTAKENEPATTPAGARVLSPGLKRGTSLLGRQNSLGLGDISTRPPWMVQMEQQVDSYLKRLPISIKPLVRDSTTMNDPLFRALDREVKFWSELLRVVRADLTLSKAVTEGKEKATNPIREVFKHLQKDKVPPHWRIYTVEDMPVPLWIDDLSTRVALMNKISDQGPGKYGRSPFWLGGLYTPEAFVAASRQAVAQAHGWSLEQLRMDVTVVGDSNDKASPDSFTFEGFTLFGASWKTGALALSNDLSFTMPTVRFTWKLVDENNAPTSKLANVPVYLNTGRTNFLFSINVACPKEIPVELWAQRGVAFTVWSQAH